MKLLQFTSLFFATVTIHAFYVQNIIYHNLSLLITVFSILTHGYNLEINNYIKKIDRIVAHYTYCYVVFHDTPIIIQIQPLIIIFPLLLLIIWILEYIYPKKFILLHSIFHLASITSLHFYLYYLHLKLEVSK